MGYKVAVVGATGNVGREMLTTLAERDFPADEVIVVASSSSIGKEVSFGEDDILKVQGLDNFDFRGIDIVLSSPGAKVGRAGGQPAGDRAVHQARHYCQSELFDDSDGRGAEAVA